MTPPEAAKDLMKGYRANFWVIVSFSVLNTLFMLNIYANGLDSLPQVIVQFPMLLTGVILFIINTVRGFKYTFGSENLRTQKGWKPSDDLYFYLSFGILIYNLLIMWFLAR